MSLRIRIGICDDDIKICEMLYETLSNYEKIMQISMDVKIFYSGEKLLIDLEKGEYFDILFLDIQLEMLDGLNVALKIRGEMKHHFTHIFFISAYKQDVREILRARPVGLITKPVEKKDIYSALLLSSELNDALEPKELCFEYRIQNTHYKIPIKNIIYFQKNKAKIDIVTKQGRQSFYDTIQNIYNELKEFDFVCPDQSYLVNFSFVENFSGNELKLYGIKDIFPVARSRYGELEAKWRKFRFLKYIEDDQDVIG